MEYVFKVQNELGDSYHHDISTEVNWLFREVDKMIYDAINIFRLIEHENEEEDWKILMDLCEGAMEYYCGRIKELGGKPMEDWNGLGNTGLGEWIYRNREKAYGKEKASKLSIITCSIVFGIPMAYMICYPIYALIRRIF